jgi:hypothetical protein
VKVQNKAILRAHVKGHFDVPVSRDNDLRGFCEDASEHITTSFDVSLARKCQVCSHLKKKGPVT